MKILHLLAFILLYDFGKSFFYNRIYVDHKNSIKTKQSFVLNSKYDKLINSVNYVRERSTPESNLEQDPLIPIVVRLLVVHQNVNNIDVSGDDSSSSG